MARKKKAEEDPWARYFAIQLTPEQKAAARAEVQKQIDRAKAEGVYEKLLELSGNIAWSISVEELRDKES
ncbi:MAG: hypothetical protein JOZ54_19430 [Acidobacteria bacterium]|nr:hypothetical protein [Acidobacteriota bacterium]